MPVDDFFKFESEKFFIPDEYAIPDYSLSQLDECLQMIETESDAAKTVVNWQTHLL